MTNASRFAPIHSSRLMAVLAAPVSGATAASALGPAPSRDAAVRQDAARRAAMQECLAREAAVRDIRAKALAMAEEVTGEPSRDVNYIIPRFTQSPLTARGQDLSGIGGGPTPGARVD